MLIRFEGWWCVQATYFCLFTFQFSSCFIWWTRPPSSFFFVFLFLFLPQGLVWVLEIEKVPKTWLTDKRPREQMRNKGIVEVAPVRKYAKLKDQSLILTESDGSHTKILLKDCTIEAVSATSLSSRKWYVIFARRSSLDAFMLFYLVPTIFAWPLNPHLSSLGKLCIGS